MSTPSAPAQSEKPIVREMDTVVSPGFGDEPVMEFCSSNGSVDRYCEVIDPAGWDLVNYLRNPVFQNCHCYGDVTDTIGRAVATEVRNGMLWQRIEFAVDANPLARVAYGLYKGGFLRAVSVGFRPKSWVDYSESEMAANGGCRRRYTAAELWEVSAVSIPANPDALALGIKSGVVQRSDMDALHDLLVTLRSHPSPSSTSPAAGGALAGDWERLLERTHAIMCGR